MGWMETCAVDERMRFVMAGPEQNGKCVTHVAGQKCYPCPRLLSIAARPCVSRLLMLRGPLVTLPRRRFLCLAGAVAVLPALAPVAIAQAYPTRPLRWIVGYPAGGATDTVMRIVGNLLSERLGQPVVIENRPGAATNLATQAVATAPPDGYTLLFVATTNAVNATLYETLPFNFLRDIAPVSGLVEMPLVLVVNPSISAATVAEFIEYAKANPGIINVASFGTGTISHLAIELLKAMTGLDVVHVPYRGGASMVADLLGGRVQAGVDALPNALPHVQRGALRALAVMSAKRADAGGADRRRNGCRLRREHLDRRRRAGRHAAGNRRQAQSRDQCRPGDREPQDAARRHWSFARLLHARRVRRTCRGGDREVGQGHQVRRREGGIKTESPDAAKPGSAGPSRMGWRLSRRDDIYSPSKCP